MMQVQFIRFLFTSFLVVTIVNAAQLPGNWPIANVTPPVREDWNALVDMSALPNAAVLDTVGVCPPTEQDTCNWSCIHCNRPSDVVFCPTPMVWALTFDDGPSEYTSGLLDYLDEKGVNVTFFVIGSHVIQYPDVVKRAVDSGHEIGIHTWSHKGLTTQTNEEIIAELKWTEAAIQAATGYLPKLVRPPYGDMDDRVRGIFDQLGYTPIIWDLDSSDWRTGSDSTFLPEWITGNFSLWVQEKNPKTGHISLEHDLYQKTALAAPGAQKIVEDAGYNMTTVSGCLSQNPYKNVVSMDQNNGATGYNVTGKPGSLGNSNKNSVNGGNSSSNENAAASASGTAVQQAITLFSILLMGLWSFGALEFIEF